MILGIVGCEAAKFTKAGEHEARKLIRDLARNEGATSISSGHCHLGGIDIWAEEVADELELGKYIFPPKSMTWTHYKERNIQIAEKSQVVYCISVTDLPETYTGMRFPLCYHCARDKSVQPPDHVKSGGCWTTKYARSLGKHATTFAVSNAG
jgi:hypothetical protein